MMSARHLVPSRYDNNKYVGWKMSCVNVLYHQLVIPHHSLHIELLLLYGGYVSFWHGQCIIEASFMHTHNSSSDNQNH